VPFDVVIGFGFMNFKAVTKLDGTNNN